MQYLGGKARLAKKLAPFIDAELKRSGGILYEPFVGGFNIVPALSSCKWAWCSDVHHGLIKLWQAVQSGWVPPECMSREEYEALKSCAPSADNIALHTFAAFGCSFSGKEWGGYASNKLGHNYCRSAKNSILMKAGNMRNVAFGVCAYNKLNIPLSNSVVYCDPPYAATTGYKTGDFNSLAFYAWCEVYAAAGVPVLVSEFTAPEHWEVLAEFPRKVTVRKDSNYATKIDKLYRVTPAGWRP